jgi:hypothetical protein
VSPVETFGLGEGATWRAVDISHRDGLTHFDVQRDGRVFGVLPRRCSASTTSATPWRRSPSARAQD